MPRGLPSLFSAPFRHHSPVTNRPVSRSAARGRCSATNSISSANLPVAVKCWARPVNELIPIRCEIRCGARVKIKAFQHRQ